MVPNDLSVIVGQTSEIIVVHNSNCTQWKLGKYSYLYSFVTAHPM